MMKTLTCTCGHIIPYRNVPEHYRLTTDAAAIRATYRLGVQVSVWQRFMDKAERDTNLGQTILRLPTPGMMSNLTYARTRDVVRRCERIGYLEYVCPRCEEAIAFPTGRTVRTVRAKQRT